MELKQTLFHMYRKRYERENQYQTCEALFVRHIGVDTPAHYDDALATLQALMDEHQGLSVFFEGSVPMQAEFNLIESIKNELAGMDVTRLSSQAITIFTDPITNQRFLQALETVVNLALEQEQFFSEFVRNDFITKLIVWAYVYLTPLDFDGHYLPKCIYYGEITNSEIYFLLLTFLCGVDVLYLHPLQDQRFALVDTLQLSTCEQALGVAPIETFAQKVQRGTAITQVETATKQIEAQIHDQFFEQTGMYKPWQFRAGTTQSLTLDTIIEDIFVYWDQEARMRPNFKVVQQTVFVPNFFLKIDGVYADRAKYKRLVETCRNSPQTLFFTHGQFTKTDVNLDEMYQLLFCQLSDGSFASEEVRKLPFYRFGKYSDEVQNFVIAKANECFQNDRLFATPLTNEQKMHVLYLILTSDEAFIRAIDNFDFTRTIPKLVLFLGGEAGIGDELVRFLTYLQTVGWDIVIFNPAGLFNLNKILLPQVAMQKRLEQMEYEATYETLMRVKKGLFANFKF